MFITDKPHSPQIFPTPWWKPSPNQPVPCPALPSSRLKTISPRKHCLCSLIISRRTWAKYNYVFKRTSQNCTALTPEGIREKANWCNKSLSQRCLFKKRLREVLRRSMAIGGKASLYSPTNQGLSNPRQHVCHCRHGEDHQWLWRGVSPMSIIDSFDFSAGTLNKQASYCRSGLYTVMSVKYRAEITHLTHVKQVLDCKSVVSLSA